MRVQTMSRLCVVLLASCGAALAYPTLTGPTGQAVIATAEMARPGLTLAADWVDLTMDSSGGIEAAIPIRANFALGDAAEIGVLYDPFDSDLPLKDALGINAKVNIGSIFNGDMVLGGQYRRERMVDDEYDGYLQGYYAWTTDFGDCQVDISNLTLTWGVNWTQVEPAVGDTVDDVRGFAGATLRLTRVIQLLAEYQTRSTDLGDDDPISALSARFFFSPSVAAQAGFTNAVGMRGTADQAFFAGLNLTFIFDTYGDYWDYRYR